MRRGVPNEGGEGGGKVPLAIEKLKKKGGGE